MNKACLLLALLWPVTVAAQPAPTVVSSLRSTSTAAGSVKVGCALTGPCTGGLTAGALDVASVTSAGFIEIASNVPASQTNRLVNNAGTLSFNGVVLATGASLSGTLNTIPVFTASNAVGNSIMTQNVGATILTVAGALNATTLGGALSTAVQPNVTTMAALTSIGTIATGTWNATIIGLSKGGAGVSLAGTGGASQFLRQNTVGGTITVVRPAIADLSDGTNVAVLNATNAMVPAAGASLVITRNSGVSSIRGTSDLALDGSSGAGGLYLNAIGTGPIVFGNKWGVNVAGDFTFGASSNIADSSGTPTIATGFGTSPTIAGTDYAFKVVKQANASSSGTVNFGHTWTTTPICVLATSNSTFPVVGLTSASTSSIGFSWVSSALGAEFYVLCRSY